MRNTRSWFLHVCVVLAVVLAAPAAAAQQATRQSNGTGLSAEAAETAEGVVVSSSRNAIVIRTDEGDYEVFMLDTNTARPDEIPVRSRVDIAFERLEGDSAPAADVVRVTEPAAEDIDVTLEPVPPAVRQLERDVQRQSRLWRLGVRTGATLDPELVMIGVQSQIGPFFQDNVWARPNFELGFGEVTTLLALNLDGAYRLPVGPQRGRWLVFAGAGIGLNFYKLGFSGENTGDGLDDDRFDFSDLDLDTGLNFFIGMQSRNGMFLELRSAAYARPGVRFQVGYNFF